MAIWQGVGAGNWSNSFNWVLFTPPNSSTVALISSGNVVVNTAGNAALLVDLAGNRTVDVGAGGGLTIGAQFAIASGSSLVVHDAGSVFASVYDVSGTMVIGGATPGIADTSGTVVGLVSLNTGGKLIFNTNDQSTFSSSIIGSGSVEQNGSGAGSVVTLSGGNTYTGATTIYSSMLFAINGNAIGDSSAVTVNAPGQFGVLTSEVIGSLAGNGSVNLYSSNLTTGGNNATTTFLGVIGNPVGTGGLTKAGTGTFTLSGANTYDGSTNVSAGALRIANASALGSTAGGTQVLADAALEVAGNISVAEALTLNGTGVSNGGALRNISGGNTWTGAITLGSEAQINTDLGGQLTIAGGITGDNQNLILGVSGQLLVSSAITTGSGSLTKDGGGLVTLSGANTYTGVTTVNAGTLEINNGAGIADAGAVIVNAPGVFAVYVSETIGSLAGGGRVFLSNTTTLTTGGDNSSTTFSGDIVEDTFNSITNLTKTGTGTFTLSGANTYTGLTTVSEGVLRIENASALGSTAGGTSVAADAALEVQGGTNVAEALTLNGTGVSNGGALRNISGDNIWSGAITLGSESRINADLGSISISGGVSGANQNLIVGGDGLLVIDSTIATGTGSLTKDGAGTVDLYGANTYTGATTVNDGTLELLGGAAIADTGAVVVNAPGVLQVFDSETIGSLAGGGRVALFNDITLTTGGANTSTTFSGVIGDSDSTSSLTKTGTGTFTLTGENTYDGVTTVSAGVLRIESNNALGSAAGATTVEFGATLEVQGGIEVAEALTLIGDVNRDTLRSISGDNVWSGAITSPNSMYINVVSDRLTLTGGVSGANLFLEGNGTLSIDSAITIGDSLVFKNGAGLAIFSGANTYTGPTNVTAGNLRLVNGAAIADTGAVAVLGSGVLQVFDSETIGSLVGSGGVELHGSTLTTGGANTNNVFAGVISNSLGPGLDAGGLTKIGSATFTLFGSNTYDGVTTIASGTLRLEGPGSIANSSNVVIANNAAFNISAISGASASIRDFNFAGPGAAGSIILGGKTLLVTHANGDFGAGVIKGGAATDRLDVAMDAAATSVSLAGLTFNTWTNGVDTISITGNALANTITGSESADIINGGAGADALNGGGGQDTVDYSASVAGLTVDLLTPSGNTGVAAGDTYVSIENIRGSGLNDTLRGNAGNNIINGGAGTDGMSGRGGDDTYIVDNVGDRVYESTTPTSGIDSGGLDTVFSSVTISLDGYSGIRFVENLTLAAGAGSINGFGNAKDNVLTGNTGNNTLDGGLGNDTMLGGAGNDIYVVDSINDRVFETTTTASLIDATGIDTIQSSVTLSLDAYAGVRFVERLTLTGTGNINGTGNGLGNVLIGNSGNNTLNGGLGADTMGGGAGNDIYVVDSISDRVFETTAINTLIDAGGDDTMLSSVSTSIDAYAAVRFIERLTLTGTDNLVAVGNAKDNVLLGNSGNNTLNGGLGNDTMGGGAGNDIYVVDSINDRVFETVTIASLIDAGGVDTVQSSVTLSLDANAAIRFVERLTLTGTGNIDGVGNGQNNVMIGNSGNNVLNGGLGNDIMGGGAGNDTYVVDSIGDFVFETTTISTLLDAGGVDTIVSSLTMNLDDTVGLRFVENLTLTGTAKIDGMGNALANVLTGNSGNNTLNGGLGNDTMIGGLGADRFVFSTTLGASNIDQITGFSVVDDTITLEDSIFVGVAPGVLAGTAFAANLTGEAADASDRIIYETDTGGLFYDVDGLGGVGRVQFATLSTGLALTNADFFVF